MSAMNHKYPEAPSTPTPTTRKRSNSAVHDEDEQRILGSQKRLRIIEETLNEQKTPSASSQSNHLKLADEVSAPSRSFRFSPETSQNAASGSRSIWSATPLSSSQGSLGPSSQVSSPAMVGAGFSGQHYNTSVHDQTRSPSRLHENEDHELTADSIADMIRQLGAQVPNYIRKLERKKAAAEKGRDARDTKISSLQAQIKNLEEEVERLKSRERELEEVIVAYEQQ